MHSAGTPEAFFGQSLPLAACAQDVHDGLEHLARRLGGRPAPGLRTYVLRVTDTRSGTSGSTRAQNSFDTTHESIRLAAIVHPCTAFAAARMDSLLFTDKLLDPKGYPKGKPSERTCCRSSPSIDLRLQAAWSPSLRAACMLNDLAR